MSFIYFILLLSVIVIVHELGHFVCAKWAGLYVPEFSIGMGPKLWQIKKGETRYTIRLLPIGGYVAMAGEESAESNQYKDESIPYHRTFKGAPHYKQMIIILAGVIMNFLLAFVVFFGIFAYNGQVVLPPEPIFQEIIANSPAEEAQLLPGDRIIEATFVDGTSIKPKTYYDFANAKMFYDDLDPIDFVIKRGDELFEITLVPRFIEEQKATLLGFVIPKSTIKEISFLEAIPYALLEVKNNVDTLFMTLGKIVRGRGLDMLAGPVGIYQAAETTATYGLTSFLALIAMLSVNVAIFNLLPLPILDGGRAILILFEMITKKKVNQKFEMVLTVAGMVLFVLLFVYVTGNDLIRLFS